MMASSFADVAKIGAATKMAPAAMIKPIHAVRIVSPVT